MTKKQQVSDLWRLCFGDTEEFIRFYFDRKYCDENALVYEKEGDTLAALQMLSYPMTWEGTEIMTSYISGACTLPEARNKGYMRQLLIQALRLMKDRHIAMSTLIPAEPWLFDYYEKFGYVAVFEYIPTTYTAANYSLPTDLHITSPESYEEETAKTVFSYFDRQMKLRANCIQHTCEDFLAIAEDLYANGGRMIILHKKNAPTPLGLALVCPTDKGKVKIKISEMVYDTDNDKQALLKSISTIWKDSSLTYKAQGSGQGASRFGMARVTDVFQMLQHYALAHPGKTFSIELTDPILPENAGIYLLDKGICYHGGKQELPIHIKTDIATLTQVLLGHRISSLPGIFQPLFMEKHPYMSLMLD